MKITVFEVLHVPFVYLGWVVGRVPKILQKNDPKRVPILRQMSTKECEPRCCNGKKHMPSQTTLNNRKKLQTNPKQYMRDFGGLTASSTITSRPQTSSSSSLSRGTAGGPTAYLFIRFVHASVNQVPRYILDFPCTEEAKKSHNRVRDSLLTPYCI